MPDFTHRPRLAPIVQGQDVRFQFHVQRVDTETDRDWTGATVSVEFTPANPADAAFTKAGVLDADPTTAPQAYVDIVPGDTSGFQAPQLLSVVITTTLASGNIDKCRFEVPLVQDS
jgi:hypothetical protein